MTDRWKIALAAATALALPYPGAARADAPSPAPVAVPVATPVPSEAPAVRAVAHRAISTRVPEAQMAYDHGLLMLYAFNIGAARESFTHAADLDPQCAMAYYGEALTEITDINVDTSEVALDRGRTALASAASAKEATADERQLIAAAALRFKTSDQKNQQSAQTAYENAMRTYAKAHSEDVDGLVETAFAIWKAEPTVKTATAAEIGADLDAALAADPAQFGAHHLRIHFEEETGHPAVALPDADFLFHASYDPGESHLPHMAGHIYDRVGDYEKMIAANQIALSNDADYFAHDTGPGVDYMRSYHNHDLAFVMYGLTTLGRYAEAREVAKHENNSHFLSLIDVRSHAWKDVVGETQSKILLTLARAGLGEVAAASSTLALENDSDAETHSLMRGAIAHAKGDAATSVAEYAAAYAGRPSDLGDPKEHWETPYGESYGAALLRAGRFADAEKVFTDELDRYPNDPRLSIGRALAKEGQHEDGSADRAAAKAVWRGDAPLTLSDLG